MYLLVHCTFFTLYCGYYYEKHTVHVPEALSRISDKTFKYYTNKTDTPKQHGQTNTSTQYLKPAFKTLII